MELKLQFGTLNIGEKELARLDELGYTAKDLEGEIRCHTCDPDCGTPAIYCGTYAKYNSGSLKGMWIDLTSFSDYDFFIEFCNALHCDEDDPELMFQDYANFPEELYSESGFDEDSFDAILKYMELCDSYEKDAVDAFIDCRGCDYLDNFEEAYQGKWDDEEDFARNIVNECYDLSKMGDLEYYFDYDKYARDLFNYDYDFVDGYVFRYL